MKLRDYITEGRAYLLERPDSRDAVLKRLSEQAAAAETSIDPEQLYEALLEREAKGATAMPEGVALPHALLEGVEQNMVFVASVRGGVDFKAQRGGPVDLIFMLVGPKDAPWEHIRLLARIARICHTPGALDRLRESGSAAVLYERLVAEDKRHV
ncbi:MAG: PTS sugar transporter subunit IIA [Phycisphaeraceae bacterium]